MLTDLSVHSLFILLFLDISVSDEKSALHTSTVTVDDKKKIISANKVDMSESFKAVFYIPTCLLPPATNKASKKCVYSETTH